MSLFRRLILTLGAGGAGGLPEYRKDANIFSDYNLCSNASEKLVVTLTSLATLSVSEVRLTASPPAAGVSLCTLDREVLTPTLDSAYDLSTEETPP